MANSGILEAPLVSSNSRSWPCRCRLLLKIAAVATAVLALAVAGFFLIAQSHGEASMPTESLLAEAPKSVPEFLKLYPEIVSVKHVNHFFEQLPAHDMEDLVFQHIKMNVEELYHSFLKTFGTTAPHFKTGERVQRRYKLEDKAEFSHRLNVFASAFRDIIRLNNFEARHNLRPDRAVFAVNKFADWTWAEFKTLLKGPATKLNTTKPTQTLRGHVEPNMKGKRRLTPPCSKNWAAEHPSIFAARDQGDCGSCYAHAAAEEIRALAFLNTGVDPGELSVQYVMDCKGAGCNGGDAGDVMEWVAQRGGIPRKIDYGPYHARKETCKSGFANAVTTTGAQRFYKEAETANKLCTDGPLSMGLYANDAFHHYHSGVLSGASCKSSYPNHDTQVVGVLEDRGAFLIRNSWGSDWGLNPVTLQPGSGSDGGFILLEYGKNTCDITDCNSFPKNVSCIGDCNDHPTPAPTPPPTPVPDGYLCGNTCAASDDGACDDGGSGSSYSVCPYGSDCDDCGSRPPPAPTPPPTPVPYGYLCGNDCRYADDRACDDGGPGSSYSVCPFGSDCDDCGSRPPPGSTPPPTPVPYGSLCGNDCSYSDDGACDDGGPGSSYSVCPFGSDCDDCGSRPPPASTQPPTEPPTALDGSLCGNTCRYSDDGACDDGGPGFSYSLCAYATDCDDCGSRPPSQDSR